MTDKEKVLRWLYAYPDIVIITDEDRLEAQWTAYWPPEYARLWRWNPGFTGTPTLEFEVLIWLFTNELICQVQDERTKYFMSPCYAISPKGEAHLMDLVLGTCVA
jgi:hypothetical protein